MGGFGGGNAKSDSLRAALETYKTKGENHMSEYHKQLVQWTRNVDKRYAWVVLVSAFIMMTVCLGPYRIYGLIFARVTESGEYTREEASWPVTMIFTVENLVGPLVSVITYFISFQQSLFIGGLCLTIGTGVSYFSRALWLDILFLGVVQGIGYGFIFMPFMEIINQYFLKYRNIALGLALCGGTVSVFVWSPITRWILDNYEWRVAYLGNSIISVLLILMVPLLKPNPRPILGAHMNNNNKRPVAINPKQGSKLAQGPEDGASVKAGSSQQQGKSGKNTNISRLSLRALSYQNSIRRQTTMLITRKTSITQGGLRREESVISLNPFASSAGLERSISRTILDGRPVTRANVIQRQASMAKDGSTDLDATEVVECETVSLSEVGQNSEFDINLVFEIVKTPAFHLICYNELIYFWVFSIYCLVLADLGIDRGCTKEEADLLLSYQSLGELVGRIGLTILVDLRFLSNKNVVIIDLFLMTAFLVAVTQVTGFVWMAFLTAGVSALSALLYITLNGLLVDFFGERQVTLGYGMSSFIAGVFMIFRPQAVGYFRDYLGSYDLMMISLGAACGIGALLWIIEPLVTRLVQKVRGIQEG